MVIIHSFYGFSLQNPWETVFVAALREINCVKFGRIASLSASVLFAGGYVVRIVYESFLDFGFSEFFMLLEWRTAFSHIPLRFQYHLIKTSVKGDSLSPLTISLRRAEPARTQFAYGEKTVSGLHGFAFIFRCLHCISAFLLF